MKKILAVFLMMTLLLTGCTATPVVVDPGAVSSQAEKPESSAAENTVPESGKTESSGTSVRTGLTILTDLSGSTDAGDENGEAKFDVVLVAVTVDDNGVIDACMIDGISSGVSFDTAGAITTDIAAEILSKNELGDDYGMKQYGGAQYEWYEQAAALADYAVGKTILELREGAVNESGKAADADLASVATIQLGGYVDAIETAVEHAEHLGAEKGDTLRLASISDLTESVEPSAEGDGTAQLNCSAAAITLRSGTITSCVLDGVQAKVNFDAAGRITSDRTAAVQTKNQLGEAYGMKQYAGSRYEWNEQATAFAEYVKGKTPAEVSGIAVNEKLAPTDPDLASTVTISVGNFMALIEKAAQ